MTVPRAGASHAGTGKPPAIKAAVALVWALVALAVVGSVLTVVVMVYLDGLIDQALHQMGPEAPVPQEGAEAVVLVVLIGVTAFALVVAVGLNAVLAIFLNKGRNWARIALTAVAVLNIMVAFGWLFGGTALSSPMLVALQLLRLALTGALLFCLWRPESSAWFNRPRAYA